MDLPLSGTHLRVVHIISGLGHGGAETVLHRVLTATTQASEHVVISMSDEGVFGPRLRDAGIPVYTLGMKGAVAGFKGVWRMHRLLRQLRPDVVQTWMYHGDLIGGLVARLAGIRAVSWGIRNSGVDLGLASRSSRICAAISAPLSRVVPAVIVACARNAVERHSAWGYDRDRFVVVPNGYDLSQWQADAATRKTVRASWKVDDDATTVIGCVARWNPLKDHQNLVAALGRVMQDDALCHAVLVGEGLTADNKELMGWLEHHGIVSRVTLLGRRDDVPALMQGLDLHVLSSRAEGFPNVVAEAMAAGVLNVVTDVGDAAFIVDDTGWVVPARDSDALAVAIRQALDCRQDTARLASRLARARQRVHDLFSLEAMVSNWDKVWRRLAVDYPRSRRHQARPTLDPAASACGQRLLFVVNNPAFFLSHRLPLARAAQESGVDVHVATMDGPTVQQIRAYGFTHHRVPLSRSGSNPFAEVRSMYALWRLFRQVQPDIVHAVTIKPVLYGGIAARFARVPAFVAAISGLGYIFTRPRKRIDVLRMAAILLYRLALAHPNSRVIFQNDADRKMLSDLGVVRPEQVTMVRGSGVDLTEFTVVPEPDGPVTVLCVARLLKDKGINEFVDAARLSRTDGSTVRWCLVGSPDAGNPASVSPADVQGWHDEGIIEWLGERQDIAHLYQQAHIAVLPSYREGLPKSLIEAAACGRAIVTSDVPGCRDSIEPGVSGILVPPRNALALAAAVAELAVDSPRRQAMGAAGRRLAERVFDVRTIVQQQLDVYASLARKKRA